MLAALCAVTLIAAAPTSLPRMPDGHPDLQGYWDHSTLTPLERPPDLADQEFFPPKTGDAYESLEQYLVRLEGRFGPGEAVFTGEANGIWRTPRHLPAGFGQWKGDPRGRWDGDTLVVDSTNFTDQPRFQGSGTGLHVVERLTRTDWNTLRYDFTVEDAQSFARPFTGRLWMTRTDDRIYEYACDEGNYSMAGILQGARSEERKNRGER